MNEVPVWHLKFYMGGPTYCYEKFVSAYSAEEAMDFIRKTHTAYNPFFYLIEEMPYKITGIERSKP